MIKLLIVADDFTGGLDTGVQFAAHGIATRVVTDPYTDYLQAASGAEVLVVVAETRHLPARQAYDMVCHVAQAGCRLEIPHIYKKTDSALRGNIGAELQAVLDASHASRMVFLPAMPLIGRVTVNGIHYVNGAPVSESVFGRDPFEPVKESDVGKLLALQTQVKVMNARPDAVPVDGEGILVVDARTDEDLLLAGRTLAHQGGLRIMAGCAGFAAVLPQLLGLTVGEKPTLPKLDDGLFVLCGSVNPITQRQLAYAEQRGFRRIHIAPDAKLIPGYFEGEEGKTTLMSWSELCEKEPWLILDANDEEDSNTLTAMRAKELSLTTEDTRSRISAALGWILPHVLKGVRDRTVLITGGDTLLQCMNRMGVNRMEPLLEVFPGVVLSRFNVQGEPRYVMTKSGGFGKESLLTDLKSVIEGQDYSD